MSGGSPVGVAANGTRSGKRSCDLTFMRLAFSNLLPCLPSLAAGLVPAGHHYYEGSDSSTERVLGLRAVEVSLLISIELPNIPSPNTLLPFRDARFNRYGLFSPSSPPRDPCGRSRHPELGRVVDPCMVRGSRVARTLPDRLGRSEFILLRTVRSIPDAPHPFC
jgi:hypothetical protein